MFVLGSQCPNPGGIGAQLLVEWSEKSHMVVRCSMFLVGCEEYCDSSSLVLERCVNVFRIVACVATCVSCRVVSCRELPCRVMACRGMAYHGMAYRGMACRGMAFVCACLRACVRACVRVYVLRF